MFVTVLTISQHHLLSLKTPHVIIYSNKTRNVLINITLRRVYATVVAVEKQKVLRILSVCLALVIQHAKPMPHIISSVTHPVVRHFFHIIF
jgi:hypothetical protein